ncbi:MAG: putative proteasome-type protease [Sphingomonadales bacterium]|jgi:putative proteasome-type protease|nr:putative proteasome-type protease [Sphingomonadales bacterium]
MTYCLGMLLDAGLILIADTRTNAGVDNFSSFKKLHTLVDEPDRQIFACTAGSLSMSQSVIGLIQEGLPAAAEGVMGGGEVTRSLRHATTMFRAAQLIGEAVQMANATVGKALAAINIESWVSLLLGGRIGDGPPMLFLIYNAGNFIECTPEVPFLQIGETKYGKPILDRGLAFDTPLREAVKFGFLSFDSAMRSNLGVARPLDLMVMPRAKGAPLIERRIDEGDPYFDDLSDRWARYLHDAADKIPDPPWMG